MTRLRSTSRHHRSAFAGFCALVLSLALVVGCSDSSSSDNNSEASPTQTAATVTQNGNVGGQSSMPSLAPVVKKAMPATVQVSSERIEIGSSGPYSVPAGVGTGVIYDSSGLVMTNNHVIEGASSLVVSLPDGRSFPGKVVGADPRGDLAVLDIEGSDLPVAELGDSSQLEVGDWAIAIGNALGLPGGPTVTFGVISALGRAIQEPGDSNSNTAPPYLFDMIQTDAAINPGNSGGPLLNLKGEVIGINTMVAGEATPGLQAQGIGFAISINVAKTSSDELAATGSVQHAYLGVTYTPLTPALAQNLGVSAGKGAVVVDVAPGSPAAQAGLQQGDVITEVDGQKINGESDLARTISTHKPGDKVTMTIARGSNTQQVQVTLGTAPS